MLTRHTFDYKSHTFDLSQFRRYAISAIWKRIFYNSIFMNVKVIVKF